MARADRDPGANHGEGGHGERVLNGASSTILMVHSYYPKSREVNLGRSINVLERGSCIRQANFMRVEAW